MPRMPAGGPAAPRTRIVGPSSLRGTLESGRGRGKDAHSRVSTLPTSADTEAGGPVSPVPGGGRGQGPGCQNRVCRAACWGLRIGSPRGGRGSALLSTPAKRAGQGRPVRVRAAGAEKRCPCLPAKVTRAPMGNPARGPGDGAWTRLERNPGAPLAEGGGGLGRVCRGELLPEPCPQTVPASRGAGGGGKEPLSSRICFSPARSHPLPERGPGCG